MFWADREVGLDTVLAACRKYQAAHPGQPYWQPSALLEEVVASGMSLDKFWKQREAAPQSKL